MEQGVLTASQTNLKSNLIGLARRFLPETKTTGISVVF